MSENVSFSESPGRSASPGQVVAKIGIASIGAANSIVPFSAGQVGQVDNIGYGPLAASTRRNLRYGIQKTIAALAAVDTAGVIGNVTKTGGGPLITLASIAASGDQIAGPWFSFPRPKITITSGGPLGAARGEFSFDGQTTHESIDLLPALPARVIGSVDLYSLALSSLNTLTVIVNPDGNGNKTTTFASVLSVTGLVQQIQNSLLSAATLLGTADLSAYTPSTINGKTLIFTDVNNASTYTVTFASVTTLTDILDQIEAQTVGVDASYSGDYLQLDSTVFGEESHLLLGAGTANGDLGFSNLDEDTGEQFGTVEIVGGRYLAINADTAGSSGSLVVDAGTANTLLGLAAATYNGTNSTYDIPGAGVRVTFPSGTYEENTTYDFSITAPTMAIPDFQEAATALRASGEKFAILHVVHEPADGIELLAWQSALEAFRLECATAEDNPLFFKWILGGPLAPVGDWNDTDNNVKLALNGSQAANKFNTIVHGDIFVEHIEYTGRHRTQLAHCYVEECAANAMNVNPGLGSKGPLKAAYLKDLDGSVARTEALALVKMQDHGFSVLRDDGQTPFIRAGRTRAPSTSQFTGEQTARAANECARVSRERAFLFANSTPRLDRAGQLDPIDKANIERAFDDDLNELIVKKGYASSAKAIVLGIVSTGGTDRLLVKCVFQRLANITDVDITVFVTNTVEIVEGIQ